MRGFVYFKEISGRRLMAIANYRVEGVGQFYWNKSIGSKFLCVVDEDVNLIG